MLITEQGLLGESLYTGTPLLVYSRCKKLIWHTPESLTLVRDNIRNINGVDIPRNVSFYNGDKYSSSLKYGNVTSKKKQGMDVSEQELRCAVAFMLVGRQQLKSNYLTFRISDFREKSLMRYRGKSLIEHLQSNLIALESPTRRFDTLGYTDILVEGTTLISLSSGTIWDISYEQAKLVLDEYNIWYGNIETDIPLINYAKYLRGMSRNKINHTKVVDKEGVVEYIRVNSRSIVYPVRYIGGMFWLFN